MAAGAKGVRAGAAYVELGTTSKIAAGLNRAKRRLKAFGAGVTRIGMGMAKVGMMAMAPLLAGAKAFSSMGDQVAKMAKRTGFSVQALSELTYVASQSGTEIGALENGLRRMQRSIYDAERGLSTAVDGFADLGLTVKDFQGLKPEDQFKLMADRIGGIQDPTRKAAIAMTLLGRSGTALLPMMADGAAGIDKLMKKARKLGLTMSREDAVAAERFTDAMDSLWKVMKMGMFNVGAALEPVLTQIATTLTEVAMKISKWMKANRGLIISVLKIIGLVIAGGIALAGLGMAISAVGSLLGVLATAVSALGAVLAFILSPIGLVVAAVAALGAYLLYVGHCGKILDWLGDRFGDLKENAQKAMDGIKGALAAGDVGLAAKIFWLALKVEWEKGTHALLKIWHEYWLRTEVAGHLALAGLAGSWRIYQHTVMKGWIAFTAGLSHIWNFFTTGLAAAWAWSEKILTKGWNRLKAVFDKTFDVKAADKAADQLYDDAEKRIKAEARLKKAIIAGEYQADQEFEKKRHDQAIINIGKAAERRINAADAEFQKRRLAAEAELEQARKDFDEIVKKGMAAGAAAPPPPEPGAPPSVEDIIDKVRRAMAGMPKTLAAAGAATRGTFYAQAMQGLAAAGSGPAERTAEATERTAKFVKKIHADIWRRDLVFVT